MSGVWVSMSHPRGPGAPVRTSRLRQGHRPRPEPQTSQSWPDQVRGHLWCGPCTCSACHAAGHTRRFGCEPRVRSAGPSTMGSPPAPHGGVPQTLPRREGPGSWVQRPLRVGEVGALLNCESPRVTSPEGHRWGRGADPQPDSRTQDGPHPPQVTEEENIPILLEEIISTLVWKNL